MNTDQLDQLRDALRRDAQQIEPVGLGVETVQDRGRRRRNRGRAVVAACAATCVAGAGIAVVNRGGGTPHQVAVARSAGTGPAPALAFRTVNGTVAYGWQHFTSPDGVTYELSTAPVVAGQPGNPLDPGQAIYRSSDGEHWDAADQGRPWITDLTQRDGVLYAIGTAPGATSADAIRYRIGTSHDGGRQWSDADLPFESSAPRASVLLTRSTAVQVARGPSATVALLSEQFDPDLSSFIAARTTVDANVSTKQTDDGFAMLDIAACAAAKVAIDRNGASPAREGKLLTEAKCTDPPVLGTITWAELGLHGPGDLRRQQILVSTDGTHWDRASAPTTGFVRDLVANDAGFMLLTDDPAYSPLGSRPGTALLQSSDARRWNPVSTPAGLNVQAVAGDRIVGVDESGAVQTSTDAGTTWNTTGIASQLPAGTPAATGWAGDAGPLGFAVLVLADANPDDSSPGRSYLLFSSDGISWSATDLVAAGLPAHAYANQVTVGADHVGVDYERPRSSGTGPVQIVTLLGTPQR